MKKSTFLWKPFLKSLAAIAIPVALQNLLTTTGSMVDTMMIAPLGETTVGAIGLCAQFTSLMFSCYWGFVGGGTLFFSQYWGAKDDDGIYRSFGTTLAFMAIVAVTFMSLGVFFPALVMKIYTNKPNIQAIGVDYLRIVGFSYPLSILSVIMSTLLRSTGRARIPMFAAIGSVCTNISMNWVLIFGHFGFPALGVRGAAIATVSASAVNFLILLIAAAVQKYPYFFHLKRMFAWTKSWMRIYLQKCFPIILNELFIGIGNMIINIVLGRQSEQAIAAIAVFRTLEGLVIGFFAGFASAAAVLVGNDIGAGYLEDGYRKAIRMVYLCAGSILIVVLLLFSAHPLVLTSMGLSGESFRIGRSMLLVYCVIAVIRMSNWIQNDTYRAAGDAAYGTILEIVFMYFMILPCLLITAFVIKPPFLLVFACCYIDEPIRFVMMQYHMFNGKWVKPVTAQGMEALPAFMEARRKHK